MKNNQPFSTRHGGRREGAGRKPGVPNRLSGQVKEMILDALDNAGGVEYLAEQANQNPAAFMTLLGKVLPLQVTGDAESPLQTVTRIETVIIDAAAQRSSLT